MSDMCASLMCKPVDGGVSLLKCAEGRCEDCGWEQKWKPCKRQEKYAAVTWQEFRIEQINKLDGGTYEQTRLGPRMAPRKEFLGVPKDSVKVLLKHDW